jgi:threonylcarbamoyladenosine tRNA methylthiotransferase MtaB
MRVQFKTLGCRLNEAEIETWAKHFQSRGHRIIGNDKEPTDLLIINSCAVTRDAVKKSRHLIRQATRQNPEAKIVVTGCYATLDAEEASQMGVDLIVSNQEKQRLPDIAIERLHLTEQTPHEASLTESPLFSMGRHRAFVKVQDGCRHHCTYCIVKIARGEETSRSIQEIVDEIRDHHIAGIQEVVLTGVHLGGYGSDLGINLTALIRNILNQTQIPRIRLGSLEPWDIPAEFIDLFENPRLLPHLHLPMQSGSNSVLKRMARRCRTEEFQDLVATLRKRIPDINITTDLIVGFPGESDSEWNETIDFVNRIQFGDIHIFSFSPRQGTAAALMGNPIAQTIKRSRNQALHVLATGHRLEFLKAQQGKSARVLWEGVRSLEEGNTIIFGYTENFIKVRFPNPPDNLSYQVTEVTLGEPDRLTSTLLLQAG